MPAALDRQVRVGSIVRVPLHGRRVGGWVVAEDVEPPAGVHLQPVAKVSSIGPAPDVVAMAEWAAWRWAGRPTAPLRTASPPHAVRSLSPPQPAGPSPEVPCTADDERVVREALAAAHAVVRLAPANDPFPLIAATAARGPALIVTPSVETAALVGRRLGRAGIATATLPGGWARAAAGGCTVVGARAAAWGPAPDLSAVIVVDAHDEALVEERAPAWSAWVVAAERARRAAVPCLLVSPCPTLEQLGWGRLVVPARDRERAGWPALSVIDRRHDDPRSGLYSEALVDLVRGATPSSRVVCVLNRKGGARLLVCANCREVAVCERCQAALEQAADRTWLACRRCRLERPTVCASCGSARLKGLRPGVSRAREELEALARQPVGEITADGPYHPDGPDGSAGAVVIGTEAALHRVGRAAAVAFVEFDAELLAPRARAGEQALALLARAARLVGGRTQGGLVAVQTRQPGHPVIDAAVRADPARLAEPERAIRQALGLPPFSALALLSGPGAPEFAAALADRRAVEVAALDGGRWLVRGSGHEVLCDALASVARPAARLRIEVDPLRV